MAQGPSKRILKKNIWLVGGGQVIKAFLDINAVDEIILTIMPVLLGDGIPLFPTLSKEIPLQLIHSETFSNGVVILTYQRLVTH